MVYNEDSCEIKLESNKLVFVGKMEKADYNDVGKFLREADKNITGDNVEIDLQKLEFLNSSGIRTLAVFFLECTKKIKIKIDKELTWQRVGIVPLSKIKPNDSIVVE